jgi:hypothetical protein
VLLDTILNSVFPLNFNGNGEVPRVEKKEDKKKASENLQKMPSNEFVAIDYAIANN